MVNKCSAVGCISLYTKMEVKLHRFPLRNKAILPFWIAITGKNKGWKPTKSSRLCCNHFSKFDYMQGHKKCVLKPTSIPTVESKITFPQYNNARTNTKLQKNKNNQEIQKTIKPNNSSNCYVVDDKYGKNHNEIMEYENRCNSSYQNNNDVGNRKNQCSSLKKYLIICHKSKIPTFSATTNFEDLPHSINNSTSINNYTENIKSGIVISPTEKHNRPFLNTKEQITNSTFNKIMALNLKKPRYTQTIYSLYFKSPIIRKMLSQDESLNSLNYINDTDIDNSGTIFCNSIE